jgi:hypothetical protein
MGGKLFKLQFKIKNISNLDKIHLIKNHLNTKLN